MTSNTLSSLLVLFLSCTPALAQIQQVQFNQVLNVNGDMNLNSFQFPDGSKLETFSQMQQQIIVNQQTPSIGVNQVTGSTGNKFVAISPQSMSISTNGATDLVGGQVEMIMSQQSLQNNGVQPSNTFVAMLSPDMQSWMIQETVRSINSTDMTVRMVKRTQLDGEYMVLGRQSIVTNEDLTPFGNDPSTAVAITGTGLQENEFQDGFRLSTRATQPMNMTVNVINGVDQGMLDALQGQQTVNNYRYSIVTNLGALTSNLNQQVTVVQVPINAIRIQKMMQAMNVPPTAQVALAVAQRGVLQNPGGATGNLNTNGATTQRRGLTRNEFREEVKRQTQDRTPSNGNTRASTSSNGNNQAGTSSNGNTQAGTSTNSNTESNTSSNGNTQSDTSSNGNNQAGTSSNGNTQTGTSTNGNNPNPVASQLLLSPTFTTVPASATFDQTNMRIAVPVQQVDGEYILLMSVMGGAQGQGQAQPTPATGQTPTAQSLGPNVESPSSAPTAQSPNSNVESPSSSTSAEGTRPTTESARPTSISSASNSNSSVTPKHRRDSSNTDKYGLPKPPQGSIIVSMKTIDDMAEAAMWAGEAPITQIMNDFVMQQTGKPLDSVQNGTSPATGSVDIVV